MCLDEKTLSAYIDGELGEPWKTQVEEHLLHCQECRGRYDQMILLNSQVRSARIQDEEFAQQKQRVWNYLTKNVVEQEPSRFMRRRLYVRTPVLLGVAAAFVCLFALNFIMLSGIGTSGEATDTPIGIISSADPAEGTKASVAKGEMVNVSATDSVAIARILDDLTVEELLMLLDQKGFEVDLRLKNVTELPVSYDQLEEPAAVDEDEQQPADTEPQEEGTQEPTL